MAGLVDVFVKLVRKKFQFLADEFACRVVFTRKRGIMGGKVIYQNATTAVSIHYDFRDGVVSTMLLRPVDGKPPEYSDHANTMGLWTVLRLRAPGVCEGGYDVRTAEDMEAALTNQAELVRTYAADILRGEFSVFPELERIKKGGGS